MNWRDFIITDPDVSGGKPVVKGSRLQVEFVFGLLAEGWTIERILENYPDLNEEKLKAIFAFGAYILREERIYGITA